MSYENGFATSSNELDLLCLSHLRWDFVFQRPQHLLSRAAKTRRVFFFEEPVWEDGELRLDVRTSNEGVVVARPVLPNGMPHEDAIEAQRELLDRFLEQWNITDFIRWYYTPMALSYSRHLDATVTVYDCMDELALFKHAPKELVDNERELFQIADLVFTGGQSLYEAKRHQHHNVHAFPSSIDFEHFSHARKISKAKHPDPEDQAAIPHPRIGYCGVIDERLDYELIAGLAAARPDWQIVLIGPFAKVNPDELPKNSNIHYLGQKDYKELPHYLAGWEVAMMPFAKNDATKFISPTKTPEYLAAGLPVISTSIRDVVRPYGEQGLVAIADSLDDFICAAAECGMDEGALPVDWLERVDAFLAQTSWEKTWNEMSKLIAKTVDEKRPPRGEEESELETDFLPSNNGNTTELSPQVA